MLHDIVRTCMRMQEVAETTTRQHVVGHKSNRLWDVFSDIATSGGTLVETNTMPESNFTITQGTLTITEYGKSIAAMGCYVN